METLFFIALIILAIVIFCVVRYIQNFPLPEKSIETDYTKYKDWCPIHKHCYGLTGSTCPDCEQDYANDKLAGVYPPGINANNKNFFFVEDWIALRKLDLKWQSGEITEAEAIRQRDEYIKTVIPKRIAIAKGTDPSLEQAKMEQNQKRSQNYAGAAEYSGITIPK